MYAIPSPPVGVRFSGATRRDQADQAAPGILHGSQPKRSGATGACAYGASLPATESSQSCPRRVILEGDPAMKPLDISHRSTLPSS